MLREKFRRTQEERERVRGKNANWKARTTAIVIQVLVTGSAKLVVTAPLSGQSNIFQVSILKISSSGFSWKYFNPQHWYTIVVIRCFTICNIFLIARNVILEVCSFFGTPICCPCECFQKKATFLQGQLFNAKECLCWVIAAFSTEEGK